MIKPDEWRMKSADDLISFTKRLTKHTTINLVKQRCHSGNFRTLRSDKTNLYIDKTSLIQKVNQKQNQLLLITAPQLWGKSLNLSMIKAFYSYQTSEEEFKMLFEGTKVMECDEVMKDARKYAVLYIDFKSCKEGYSWRVDDDMWECFKSSLAEYQAQITGSKYDSADC